MSRDNTRMLVASWSAIIAMIWHHKPDFLLFRDHNLDYIFFKNPLDLRSLCEGFK